MPKPSELAAAMKRGDIEVVEQIIQEPDIVNTRDWTPPPLHCAISLESNADCRTVA